MACGGTSTHISMPCTLTPQHSDADGSVHPHFLTSRGDTKVGKWRASSQGLEGPGTMRRCQACPAAWQQTQVGWCSCEHTSSYDNDMHVCTLIHACTQGHTAHVYTHLCAHTHTPDHTVYSKTHTFAHLCMPTWAHGSCAELRSRERAACVKYNQQLLPST